MTKERRGVKIKIELSPDEEGVYFFYSTFSVSGKVIDFPSRIFRTPEEAFRWFDKLKDFINEELHK